MKNILIAIALGLFLVGGCAGQFGRNASHFDKVEAIQVEQLTGNNLAHAPFSQKVVYLNARCETARGGVRKIYLFTEIIAPSDFTLQVGESLVLNLDDEVFSFASANSPAFNSRRRFITTFYPVPSEVLIKLATAKVAKIRIKGTNAVIDNQLTRRNLMLFLEFSERCALVSRPERGSLKGQESQTDTRP